MPAETSRSNPQLRDRLLLQADLGRFWRTATCRLEKDSSDPFVCLPGRCASSRRWVRPSHAAKVQQVRRQTRLLVARFRYQCSFDRGPARLVVAQDGCAAMPQRGPSRRSRRRSRHRGGQHHGRLCSDVILMMNYNLPVFMFFFFFYNSYSKCNWEL